MNPILANLDDILRRQELAARAAERASGGPSARSFSLGIEGTDQTISIKLSNEPWFSEGIVNSDDRCPYEEGSDPAQAWKNGQEFEKTIGFEGALRAIEKRAKGEDLTPAERSVFTNSGGLRKDLVEAAASIHAEFSDFPGASAFLAASVDRKVAAPEASNGNPSNRRLSFGIEGSDQTISIKLSNEPWFSEGIVNSDERCPYEGGTDSAQAWRSGQEFDKTIGFAGALRAIEKKAKGEELSPAERSVFTKAGELRGDIVEAATSIHAEFGDDYPEVATFLAAIPGLQAEGLQNPGDGPSDDRVLSDEEIDNAEREIAAAMGHEMNEEPIPSRPAEIETPAEKPAVELTLLPEAEVHEARFVYRLVQSQAMGLLRQNRGNRISPAAVWDKFSSFNKIDFYREYLDREAPAWLTKAACAALRKVRGVPPANAVHEAYIERGTASQFLIVLLNVAPHDANRLLDQAISEMGHQPIDLGESETKRGLQLVRAMEQFEKLSEWGKQRGIEPERLDEAVLNALYLYPRTKDWMYAMDDEIASVLAVRDASSKSELKHVPALKLLFLSENPEIFESIPGALDAQSKIFQGQMGKSLDQYFHSRVLRLFHKHWSGNTGAPDSDFKTYLQAIPSSQGRKPGEDLFKFWRNYGYFALGGIDADLQDVGSRKQLFSDLISKDMVPSNDRGDISLSDVIQQRIAKLMSHVQKTLSFYSEPVADRFKFLLSSKRPEAQLRMIGQYLSKLPYRQHLLGTGPLSLVNRDILSPRFINAVNGAYQEFATPKHDSVVIFSHEDRIRIRESTGLEALLRDEEFKRLTPLVAWLQEEGRQHIQYLQTCRSADKKMGLPAGTTERINLDALQQLRLLPEKSPAQSITSLALGMVAPSRFTSATKALGDFGNPANVGAMLMVMLQAVALRGGEEGNALLEPNIANDMDEATSRLNALADKWTNSTDDRRELGELLSLPVMQMSVAEGVFKEVSTQLAAQLQGTGESLELSPLVYGDKERSALNRVLALPTAPSLLRSQTVLEPAQTLQAAVVLATQSTGSDHATNYWRSVVELLHEHVQLQPMRKIEIVALPEKGPDGLYRRARRSLVLEADDFAKPEVLSAKAAILLGVPAESITQFPTLGLQQRDWENPQCWHKAALRIERREAEMQAIIGIPVKVEDWPRLFKYAATMANKHEKLMLHTAAMSSQLFAEREGPISLDHLLKRTTELLQQTARQGVVKAGQGVEFSVDDESKPQLRSLPKAGPAMKDLPPVPEKAENTPSL